MYVHLRTTLNQDVDNNYYYQLEDVNDSIPIRVCNRQYAPLDGVGHFQRQTRLRCFTVRNDYQLQ